MVLDLDPGPRFFTIWIRIRPKYPDSQLQGKPGRKDKDRSRLFWLKEFVELIEYIVSEAARLASYIGFQYILISYFLPFSKAFIYVLANLFHFFYTNFYQQKEKKNSLFVGSSLFSVGSSGLALITDK